MKKCLFTAMLALGVMNTSAQLTVYHNGNVNIGSEQTSSNVNLSVGNIEYTDTAYHVSLSLQNPTLGCYNIGGEGVAYNPTVQNKGRAFGLRGIAGNCTSGYKFGVFGALQGQQGGAAVFGTTSGKILGLNVAGRYAGYFDGNVIVTGLLLGDIVNRADILAQSVQSHRPISNALDGITSTTPFTYWENTMITIPGTGVVNDSIPVSGSVSPTSTPNISLGTVRYALDVTTVKNIFPDLVMKDTQGNEYVNYTQLVPILIQAIKDLKEEVDDLKSAVAASETRKVNAPTNIEEHAFSEGTASVSQNTPNPFTGESTIRVSVPDEATEAYIDIRTSNGANIKRIPLNNGHSEIALSSYDFAPGTYLYTLIINGKAADTRRMIVNR